MNFISLNSSKYIKSLNEKKLDQIKTIFTIIKC